MALIDELSGLTQFLNSLMNSNNMSETTRANIRTHMHEYTGVKPKEEALNEMSIAMYGDTRWTSSEQTESQVN